MFRDSASPSRSRSGPQGSSAERGRHNAATAGSSAGETASVDPGAPFVPAACSLSPSCAESDNVNALHVQNGYNLDPTVRLKTVTQSKYLQQTSAGKNGLISSIPSAANYP